MEPNPNFIHRTIENNELLNLLLKFGSYLSNCINFGSNLVEWISNAKTLGTHDAVLIANLRHFLEQIDACSELLTKSISEPCLILLRAALESLLYSSYILQSDHKQRGKCFLYFQLLEQIKFLDKLDCETEIGKQTKAIIGKDDHLQNLTLFPPTDLAIKKSNISERINSSKYGAIHEEYTSIKTATPRAKPKWYSLFGGPTSIEALANVTSNAGLYEIFYRHASGFVHGTKILSKGIIDSEGISQIRMPFNAQFVCSFSLSLCFMFFKKYIEHYCKDKMIDYLIWYKSMREFYLSVSNEEILIIE